MWCVGKQKQEGLLGFVYLCGVLVNKVGGVFLVLFTYALIFKSRESNKYELMPITVFAYAECL